MRRAPIAFAATLAACAHVSEQSSATPQVDATLQRLEDGKWHPSRLGSREALRALFASDFISVEYGPDPMGLVYRSEGAPPNLDVVADMLDKMNFQESEWRVMPLAGGAMLLSYRVTEPSMHWTAYASSVWVHREGRWQTVFYQASRARPAAP